MFLRFSNPLLCNKQLPILGVNTTASLFAHDSVGRGWAQLYGPSASYDIG